ncbi:MAG: hypothetical protein A2Z66_08105 [Chloroflexi bacterium RBG_13_66_10]|nr:MAG: hypothetical protein A2Z66_08105 [Chloroflexi bacterium RBG_13_66_10]
MRRGIECRSEKDRFSWANTTPYFNRGVDRQPIFYSTENCRFFLALWTSNAKRHSIGVVAYCFLPNHFHFLLRPLADNKGSGFMNSLFGPYVQALNRQMR